MEQIVNTKTLFDNLESNDNEVLIGLIREILKKENYSIVVLDDDPTGTQTVHGIPVLTQWEEDVIMEELQNNTSLFYILTNSRSLSYKSANQLAEEIGNNIRKASEKSGKKVFVISRSDSTLRGHYPNEVIFLQKGLGYKNAVKILIPAFFEGGRFTVNDIHYVKEGDQMIPAAHTPFARDTTFGYHHSDLKKYVEEKTRGKVTSDQVISFSISDLRKKGPEWVKEVLKSCDSDATCIVNAVNYNDLQIFAFGLLKVNRPVICRTAASFVPALAGMEVKPVISKQGLHLDNDNGALIICGSHVPKSTSQIQYLMDNNPDLVQVEFNVADVISPGIDEKIRNYSRIIEKSITDKKNVILYTSREIIKVQDKYESLALSKKISTAITTIVNQLEHPPKYILAKGGITSSDVATDGLLVKKTQVLGQISAGVPVWQLGPESKFPGMVYIVFPGNVGTKTAIADIYRMLK